MREEQKKKMELINEVHANKGTQAGVKMVELCDFFIDELRRDNDLADDHQFKHNQGRIDAWKKMKEIIVEGIPNRMPPKEIYEKK